MDFHKVSTHGETVWVNIIGYRPIRLPAGVALDLARDLTHAASAIIGTAKASATTAAK